MKDMIKDAAVLFVITLISGLLLGFIYDLTKEPINAQEIAKKNEARQTVFPDAADFHVISEDPAYAPEKAGELVAQNGYDAAVDEIAEALDASGNLLGYVITVTDHGGYGGDITFSVGIKSDGTACGLSILTIAETAGLGMRAGEVIAPQIPGKNLSQEISYTKNGDAGESQIDAISGATITTKAFTDGINAARCIFTELLTAGKGAA